MLVEDMRHVCGGDSRAGIADTYFGKARLDHTVDMNGAIGRRVFDGIVEDVEENDAQQLCVTSNNHRKTVGMKDHVRKLDAFRGSGDQLKKIDMFRAGQKTGLFEPVPGQEIADQFLQTEYRHQASMVTMIRFLTFLKIKAVTLNNYDKDASIKNP